MIVEKSIRGFFLFIFFLRKYILEMLKKVGCRVDVYILRGVIIVIYMDR